MSENADEQLRWYAIQCKGGESFRAAEHLMRQNYHIFHPVLEVERKRRGKVETQREPLFPYYLFIRLDRQASNWRPIRSTRGVLKLVSFGREPAAVPDGLIETLMTQASESENHDNANAYFRPGAKVEITDGPFKDLEGVFINRKGEERVIVLLSILQRQQHMAFSVKQVRSVE
ncbi:transcription/translation regulatory transformer protein RfaH [Phytohalomonas tamaricis]|uniref:transcription/translation regulatory transformer protein RfaH n=1 Tax=Phytohalomonas tamaricis TaxID=2081032 RepID=UPI000D0B55C9|nr:transcription/translation regulatory transformer protein RfaH [Phytohalomonas tamaricis]